MKMKDDGVIISNIEALNDDAIRSNLKDDRGIFSNDLMLCVIDLFGLEVAVDKIPSAIQFVAKHLFQCEIHKSDLSTSSSV